MTTVYTDCREELNKALDMVVCDSYEFLANLSAMAERTEKYDVITDSDGENYIINRETGEYINWYKQFHFGRDAHCTCKPENFEEFLKDFIISCK